MARLRIPKGTRPHPAFREHPIEGDAGDEEPERKKLQRELRAEALARLEDAARTTRDFENVVAWRDKLDANRERRERYHELSRSGDDVPLDYGSSANDLFFPNYLNDVLEKQIRKGDFLDVIFNCPCDIHELVTEAYLCQILDDLDENHKKLLAALMDKHGKQPMTLLEKEFLTDNSEAIETAKKK